MMKTHLTDDERAALALGLASAEELERDLAHLKECQACRQAFAADEAILQAMGTTAPEEISPVQWNQLVCETVARAGSAAETDWEKVRDSERYRRKVWPAWIAGHGSAPEDWTERVQGWFWRLAVLASVFVAGYWAGKMKPNQALSKGATMTFQSQEEVPVAPAEMNASDENTSVTEPFAQMKTPPTRVDDVKTEANKHLHILRRSYELAACNRE